jgi:hypothetical protein
MLSKNGNGNGNINAINDIVFKYDRSSEMYYHDCLFLGKRTKPFLLHEFIGNYQNIIEKCQSSNCCKICDIKIINKDNDSVCNKCHEVIKLIIDDKPIGYINVESNNKVNKLTVFDYHHTNILVCDSIYVNNWIIGNFGMMDDNIYDCIYGTFKTISFENEEYDSDDDVGHLCKICETGYDEYAKFHEVNNILYCVNCMNKIHNFQIKLFHIYLIFKDLLITDISKVIVHKVIYFYNYIDSLRIKKI